MNLMILQEYRWHAAEPALGDNGIISPKDHRLRFNKNHKLPPELAPMLWINFRTALLM